MKKNLPVLFFLLLVGFFISAFTNKSVYAVTPTPSPTATITPSPTVSPAPTPATSSTPADGSWIEDANVTFDGKVAARSKSFLDWTLSDYKWSYFPQEFDNPIVSFWTTVRNIVYAFFVLLVLIGGFLFIVTRGGSITFWQFARRFVLVVILVTFSFALIQFLYQVTDIIQGFFLKNSNNEIISSKDLLSVAFNYNDFIGYKKYGIQYEESAFVSLLLIKLTSLTYYVMSGILLLRKIILWFFVIISPVFPILFLYYPIKNAAKIWLGEFFRWLLYAPLFAIFLSGLVRMWSASDSSQTGIPLMFDFSSVGNENDIVFPTAVNILLGGPGQAVGMTNSLNMTDTFALYLLSLFMLWMVILLPFLLLQLFLDYASSNTITENSLIKMILNKSSGLFGKTVPLPSPAQPTPPPGYQPQGMERPLSFVNKFVNQSPTNTSFTKQAVSSSYNQSQNISHPTQVTNTEVKRDHTEVLRLANLSIPKMSDIANFEMAHLRDNFERQREIASIRNTLEKIANPNIATGAQRNQFTMLKGRLEQEQKQGSPVAAAVLSASQTVGGLHPINIFSSSKEGLPSEKTSSSPKQAMTGVTALPVLNRVQTVSIDDYETVKKLWQENYQKLNPPNDINGRQMRREEWVKKEIENVTQITNSLLSPDEQKKKEGMDMVGKILPFLLIGGFSQTEVLAYLKSKLEAAKTALLKEQEKEEEEESLLSLDKKKDKEEAKTMSREIKPGENLTGDASKMQNGNIPERRKNE